MCIRFQFIFSIQWVGGWRFLAGHKVTISCSGESLRELLSISKGTKGTMVLGWVDTASSKLTCSWADCSSLQTGLSAAELLVLGKRWSTWMPINGHFIVKGPKTLITMPFLHFLVALMWRSCTIIWSLTAKLLGCLLPTCISAVSSTFCEVVLRRDEFVVHG